MKLKRFINWKSYFSEEQVNKYNLKNTNIIKLYNTNDFNMPGVYQINDMNKYLGELVMMYYIWKNNLKSEYICISQYRKDFCNIDFNKLDKDNIQLWMYWQDDLFNPIDSLFNDIDHIDPDNYLKNKFIEYLDIQKVYNQEKVNKLKYGQITYKMACLVFAMNWKVYCELCDFIFGYLDYVFPNDSWKNQETILNFKDEKYKLWNQLPEEQKRKDWIMFDNDRYIVFIIEKILMICLTSLYDCYQDYFDNIYINKNILSFGTNKFEIDNFYCKNKKVNTEKIYVKVPNNKFNELNDFFETYKYVWPNLYILHEDEHINENNLIILDINEYIDIDDIYSIKNMSIEEIKKYIKLL